MQLHLFKFHHFLNLFYIFCCLKSTKMIKIGHPFLLLLSLKSGWKVLNSGLLFIAVMDIIKPSYADYIPQLCDFQLEAEHFYLHPSPH